MSEPKTPHECTPEMIEAMHNVLTRELGTDDYFQTTLSCVASESGLLQDVLQAAYDAAEHVRCQPDPLEREITAIARVLAFSLDTTEALVRDHAEKCARAAALARAEGER